MPWGTEVIECHFLAFLISLCYIQFLFPNSWYFLCLPINSVSASYFRADKSYSIFVSITLLPHCISHSKNVFKCPEQILLFLQLCWNTLFEMYFIYHRLHPFIYTVQFPWIYILRVKLLVHKATLYLPFWGTTGSCHTVSQSGCTILHCCKQCRKVPVSPHSL